MSFVLGERGQACPNGTVPVDDPDSLKLFFNNDKGAVGEENDRDQRICRTVPPHDFLDACLRGDENLAKCEAWNQKMIQECQHCKESYEQTLQQSQSDCPLDCRKAIRADAMLYKPESSLQLDLAQFNVLKEFADFESDLAQG